MIVRYCLRVVTRSLLCSGFRNDRLWLCCGFLSILLVFLLDSDGGLFVFHLRLSFLHFRFGKRAITGGGELQVARHDHSLAVLELGASGELRLKSLIQGHGFSRELLESEEHLLVEGDLCLGGLNGALGG